MSFNATSDQIIHALRESVKLQSHYADLLNMHDGGERIVFKDVEEWLERLEMLSMKRGDKVILPGCAPLGQVLQTNEQKGVLVQWPPSSGEYVRPCWYEHGKLMLAPKCPSEDCQMCSGEACWKCGAGCWDQSVTDCEHDVIERHEDPES